MRKLNGEFINKVPLLIYVLPMQKNMIGWHLVHLQLVVLIVSDDIHFFSLFS